MTAEECRLIFGIRMRWRVREERRGHLKFTLHVTRGRADHETFSLILQKYSTGKQKFLGDLRQKHNNRQILDQTTEASSNKRIVILTAMFIQTKTYFWLMNCPNLSCQKLRLLGWAAVRHSMVAEPPSCTPTSW